MDDVVFWRVDEVDSGSTVTTGPSWSFTAAAAPAGNNRWNGGGYPDVSWDNGDNWDRGFAPRAIDVAHIKTADANDPIIDSSIDALCSILLMGNGTPDTLTMTGGSLTTCGTANAKLGDGANSTIVINQSGGVMTFADGDTLMPNSSGSFTLNLSGGTFINTDAGHSIKTSINGSGTAYLNISDGNFTSAGEMLIGDDGPTYVEQTGGAVTATAKLVMDRKNLSNGTMYNLKGGTLYAGDNGCVKSKQKSTNSGNKCN
ncbi:MAG: hypothetical protein H8D47_02140 [Planctomycetes bacterium]|nr:hypothetical protein [Planctomycetota bacterium]